METIHEGTKLVFQHVKKIDYTKDKEHIRSIDDRGVLEFDAKRGYLASLIDLKKYCGWNISIY